MLSHKSTVDVLGWATLILVIALCLSSVLCIAYVLYFRSQVRKGHLLALQDFNAVWGVRIMLITCAMLWGLIELMRSPLLRHEGGPFYGWTVQKQAALCQTQTVLSLGVTEPCFFLTALFLLQASVCDAPFEPQRRWNQKTMSLIFVCCLPVSGLQAGLVIFTSQMQNSSGIFHVPSYFMRSYISNTDEGHGAICTFPLFSTLVLGLFSCIYIFCFVWQGRRMLALVINKRLQVRVCGLVLSLAILFPAQIIFMGLSVLAVPGHFFFELLAFLSFLTVLLCVAVGKGILVVQPIADAMAVRWVFKSVPTNAHHNTLDPFSVPLCVFGCNEDTYPHHTKGTINS
ncbi:hypothetical protein KP509_08G053600 [Ceratopteris richardii]|uniref:Uncharacterized protein n=1 Tax=Ceratopteris richardii TaxID=49495 RepID=A0A8T2UD89_CERRI|nr:hypothetical protein KP509_08G053600 [Ceratopteris richardii]